jgi:hypothetical protein
MCVVALRIILAGSVSQAMDVYDWRAKTEFICARSLSMLEWKIVASMAGGRPENLVVEKVKDTVPVIQAIGNTDVASAEIIVKSLVHSFFIDSEVQRAIMNCSANVVRYDPDGSKAEAYENVRAEEQRKKNEQANAKAKAEAKVREVERQEEEHARQEEENARKEEQRRLKAEEDAREQQELEKNRAEVAERQKQQSETIANMLKNTRTEEDFAREEAERKQKEDEAQKANSGLGGLIKSLW